MTISQIVSLILFVLLTSLIVVGGSEGESEKESEIDPK
jgi:hypothetical protein